MVNFNALNSGNLVKGAAALGVSVMIGSALRGRFAPKPLPQSMLAKANATINNVGKAVVSAGKAVVDAPAAGFRGLKNLVSPAPKKPTTTPLLRAAQACLGMAAFLATATILTAAKK
ncbi:MAG: hypothetical protein WCG14_00760 [Chlamydiia bacterium]